MEQEKNETVTELFDQLHPLLLKDRCYYEFKRICEKIDALLRKRHDDEIYATQKTDYLQAFSRLSHTIGKEVEFIESHQDRMHKRNAAKVRVDEYYKAVNKAYDQVHSDILMILIHEKKEKEKKSEP